MAQTPIGPGTLLANRFVLEDLLDETEGARFWRALDRVLVRDVAVHVVSSADPRSAALLSAARTSATVADGHLLRVLDAATEDGVTYVVNEWGSGISLDKLLLSEGPLSPRRAAWVAKEVAEAVTTAHRHGIAHGRLLPENVVVTDSGSVKLIGFVVDAVLRGREQQQATGGPPLAEHEADVRNLAALLYAGLVAKWPGTAGTKVPAAPTEHGRTLRPRQVRAGIPRPLDTICERVLNPDPHRHVMPIETAHEIYAALSDFIGDPAAAPLLALEATTAMPVGDVQGLADPAEADPDRSDAAGPDGTPTGSAAEGAAPDLGGGAHPSTFDPEATQAGTPPWESPAAERPSWGEDAADSPGGGGPEATQAGSPVPDEPPADRAPADEGPGADSQPGRDPDDPQPDLGPRRSPPPPPPVLPEPEPRPLFASDQRRPLRPDLPGGMTGGGFGAPAAITRSRGDLPPVWGPDADVPPDDTGDLEAGAWSEEDAGRSWLRLAVAIGGVVVLVVALVFAFTLGRDGSPADGGAGGSGDSATSTPPQPVAIAEVTDFDPQGDPPEENSDSAGLAADGDPSTSWTTSTYLRSPELGNLKDGVGLLVDLGEQVEVRDVRLTLVGSPTSVEILATDPGTSSAPTSAEGLATVAGRDGAGTKVDLQLKRPTTTRFLVVWLTSLPPTGDGRFRGEVAEIVVRS